MDLLTFVVNSFQIKTKSEFFRFSCHICYGLEDNGVHFMLIDFVTFLPFINWYERYETLSDLPRLFQE